MESSRDHGKTLVPDLESGTRYPSLARSESNCSSGERAIIHTHTDPEGSAHNTMSGKVHGIVSGDRRNVRADRAPLRSRPCRSPTPKTRETALPPPSPRTTYAPSPGGVLTLDGLPEFVHFRVVLVAVRVISQIVQRGRRHLHDFLHQRRAPSLQLAVLLVPLKRTGRGLKVCRRRTAVINVN